MLTKIYRLLLISIAIGLIFVIASTTWALAQGENEPTGFNNVHLWIYPEYDDPRLLTILRGQIAGAEASVENPATVRFLVPSTAFMYSAGFLDAQGHYVRGGFVDPTKTINDVYPERQSSAIEGLDEITFTIATNSFVVEYYDPIIIGNPDKTIAYEFHLLYPISDLEVVIQEPRTSTNFTVSPQGTLGTDTFFSGYPALFYSFNNLIVDEDSPLQFDISYTKSDPRPSLDILDITDSVPPALIVVGIVCGVLAAIVGGFFLIRKAKQKALAERRPVRMSRKKAKRQGFCRQCGKQLDRPSPHCPYCGAKQ